MRRIDQGKEVCQRIQHKIRWGEGRLVEIRRTEHSDVHPSPFGAQDTVWRILYGKALRRLHTQLPRNREVDLWMGLPAPDIIAGDNDGEVPLEIQGIQDALDPLAPRR